MLGVKAMFVGDWLNPIRVFLVIKRVFVYLVSKRPSGPSASD